MRKIAVHLQTTLNNRIANAAGTFWEPFPWGEEETAYLNSSFRDADTWALSRCTYEAIVPWWDTVGNGEVPADAGLVTDADREFAAILRGMTKVVFSTTLQSTDDRVVISGDIAAELAAIKRGDGGTILLTCGPRTLAPLADTPGLIDEYLVVVHPAVLSAGPQMFDGMTSSLALQLTESRVFDAGSVVLRYEVARL
jgi:dihydrofolate reductase